MGNTDGNDQGNVPIVAFDKDEVNFVQSVTLDRRKFKIALHSILTTHVLAIASSRLFLNKHLKNTNDEITRNEVQSPLSASSIFKGTSHFSNIGNISPTTNDGKALNKSAAPSRVSLR